MATMLPGVLPTISFASLPTASTTLVTLFMATMEGSLRTTPRPFAKTSVFAVPRSMARSLERSPEIRGKDIVAPQKLMFRLTVFYARGELPAGDALSGPLSEKQRQILFNLLACRSQEKFLRGWIFGVS